MWLCLCLWFSVFCISVTGYMSLWRIAVYDVLLLCGCVWNCGCRVVLLFAGVSLLVLSVWLCSRLSVVVF